MKKKDLRIGVEVQKGKIIEKLIEFVNENGDDLCAYFREHFGLYYDEDEEHNVTKVLDFFNNGGCFFCEPSSVNNRGLDDINENNYCDRLYEHMTHTAYQCLYVVKDADENETLHYYRFTNGGVAWDDDQSEPEHGNVDRLSLLDLHYLLEAIKANF